MTDSVKYEVDARGVATVTLNRPALHNAFDKDVIASLSHLLTQLDTEPTVRIVIVTGEGKSFSAGADLNWMKKVAEYDKDKNKRDALELAEMYAKLDSLSKPTIARVNGAAFGGGVGLAACCDIVIASTTAQFGLSEVKLGLVPAVISPYVIAAIGFRQARRFFLTGETFSAATAQRIGLVHEAVKPEELDAAVTKQIDCLLLASQNAVRRCKKLVFDMAGDNHNRAQKIREETAELIAELRMSDEGREGLLAFLEKRSPNWQG
ncbi:MAG: enoyl-CoA hydratase/isomerase family protein [Gammaproteobacteria bacterium]